MSDSTRLRERPKLRAVTQVIIIALLIAAGWTFNDRIAALREAQQQDRATTAAVNSMLAQSCGAASFEELRKQGLVEECRLAQEGKLADALPNDRLPDPDAGPTEVDPDLVEDDENSTPADLLPPMRPSDAAVSSAVDGYLERYPLNAQPGYQRAISRTVTAYLTANPPADGRPPTEEEIRAAVRASLLANPPADGADGRGVAAAALEWCDVVFSYSDGTSNRIGPICGKDGQQGPPPTTQQIADAVAAYCTANGNCRGPAGPSVSVVDACDPPAGNYLTDVNVEPSESPEGVKTFTIQCTSEPLIPGSLPNGRRT